MSDASGATGGCGREWRLGTANTADSGMTIRRRRRTTASFHNYDFQNPHEIGGANRAVLVYCRLHFFAGMGAICWNAAPPTLKTVPVVKAGASLGPVPDNRFDDRLAMIAAKLEVRMVRYSFPVRTLSFPTTCRFDPSARTISARRFSRTPKNW